MNEDRFQDLMDAIECIIHQYEEIEARMARIEHKIDYVLFEEEADDDDPLSPDAVHRS